MGTGDGTAVPGMPLAFQGDPGKGCDSPREVGIGNGGFAWFWLERLLN